jgi:2-octaprenyl-6-methoxyphenol hydroxylase
MSQAAHNGLQRAGTDVVIGGGGFAGLALAIALREALGPSFSVMVADPNLSRSGSDTRASALVAGARRLLSALGVWERVADAAQPILDMVISDSRLSDAVRPVFLTFAGEVEEGEPFAHMVENGPLRAALVARAEELGVELRATAVAGFGSSSSPPERDRSTRDSESETRVNALTPHLDVELADGRALTARLLVAADGARSRLRQQAGIGTFGWTYAQSAIATTVAHERKHGGRAEERFLPAGPFAILPLTGRRCSIVWTEQRSEAERIVALPDAEFHAELERRFGLHLGALEAVGARASFPLEFLLARSFVAPRLALLGDAAHVIHPIAGQGLNLGLKDVAALAESIVDAARLGLDPGAAPVLERYQRWRRFDTMAMGVVTDGLNRLFSNESDLLRIIRDVGLGLVDRVPALKHAFIREAAGITGEVPKLLRGEPVNFSGSCAIARRRG